MIDLLIQVFFVLAAGGDFALSLHAARLVDRVGGRAFAAVSRLSPRRQMTLIITAIENLCRTKAVSVLILAGWQLVPVRYGTLRTGMLGI